MVGRHEPGRERLGLRAPVAAADSVAPEGGVGGPPPPGVGL